MIASSFDRTASAVGRCRVTFIVCAAFATVLACGSDDDVTAPDEDATFEEVFDQGGEFEVVSEKEEVSDSVTTTEVINNENWLCTTKTYDIVKAPDEFPLFDPNSEIVFPGNLLQGRSLERATPDPIPVKRGDGTIVLTLMNGAPLGVSQTVPEVTLSNIYDAANEIISQNPGDIPARFSFTMERVESQQQLALAANVSASFWGGSIAASLRFSTDRKYNRFLVKLTQSFYTIAFELPTTYGEMFDSTVTPTDLARYVGPGNPAAFISSVTYGRIFYLLIESTERVDSMSASINASFSGWKAGASGKYVGSLKNLSVKAFALGGDAADALSAVTDDFDALKSFLSQGGNISTGVPISYVVRSVRNPERIVKVGLNTTYDVTDCVPIMETFGDPIVWLMADSAMIDRHPTTPNRVTRWRDLSAKENDAYTDSAVSVQHLPEWRATAVNGEMPAMVFGDSSTLRFVGADFANSDYTLTIVGSFILGQNLGLEIISGSTAIPKRMLRVGFEKLGNAPEDPLEFHFDHFDDSAGVHTTRVPPPYQFHVYTLVFSRQRGMAAFVDGREAAWDPLQTDALEDFMGARLGNVHAVPNASVQIAELLAFRTALTDDQRLYLEDNLIRKYKF